MFVLVCGLRVLLMSMCVLPVVYDAMLYGLFALFLCVCLFNCVCVFCLRFMV